MSDRSRGGRSGVSRGAGPATEEQPHVSDCERQGGPNRLLERGLRAWVGFVERHPKRILAISVVLALASLVYAAMHLGFKTSRDDLVNPSEGYLRHWKNYEREFGGEMDIIVAVEGADRDRMTAAIEAIAGEIAAHPKQFEKLCHRIRVDRLIEKGLFQLPLEDLRSLRGAIEPLRPLLVGGWGWMSLENVLRAARFQLHGVGPERPLDENSRRVFQSAARTLESLEVSLQNPRTYRSPWESMIEGPLESGSTSGRLDAIPEYFFSPDGGIAFLTVLPIRESESFTGTAASVALARKIVERVQGLFPDLSIGVTGMPVLEADEMTEAISTGTSALGISLAGVIILFVVGFRALRHPAYAIVTILISFCWMIGWTTLTIGHLNIISASFLSTLIGLGDDFWILWLSRYEADRARGISVQCANVEVANAVGPSIVVGAGTAALAFFCTMSTGFLGLREMGWITGSGMLLFMIGVITVLPALLVVGGRQKVDLRRARFDDVEAFGILNRRPWMVVTGFVGAALVLLFFAPRVKFDYNLLNLQAHGTPAVEWEKKMIERSQTSGWYALSMADSAEEARALKAKFASLDCVGQVVEIASLTPTQQEEKAPLIREIHDLLGRLPTEEELPRLAPPRPESLVEILSDLAAMEESRRDGPDRLLLERLRRAAGPALSALKLLPPGEQARRLAEYERIWVHDLLRQLHRLRAVSNPEPVTAADLPPALAERYLSPSGKWLLQVFAKQSVWDIEPLRKFCAAVASVDPQATGKPISTLWSLTQMTEGYVRSAQWAVLVVCLFVWFDLRSVRDLALAAVPLAFGASIMFGIMGIFGVALNPANMIVLPMIVGIGLDAGVHVLHDFRETKSEYRLSWRLARALALTGATTVIGFGSLLCARHWGIISTGLVISIGVAGTSVAALILLPAALKLVSRGRREHEAPAIPFATPARRAA